MRKTLVPKLLFGNAGPRNSRFAAATGEQLKVSANLVPKLDFGNEAPQSCFPMDLTAFPVAKNCFCSGLICR
jgi:hypothetical protein